MIHAAFLIKYEDKVGDAFIQLEICMKYFFPHKHYILSGIKTFQEDEGVYQTENHLMSL